MPTVRVRRSPPSPLAVPVGEEEIPLARVFPPDGPVQLYEGRRLAADDVRDVVAAIGQQDDGVLAAGIDDGDGTVAECDPDLLDGFTCGHDAPRETKPSGASGP